MKDDVKKYIYGAVIVFVVGVLVWVGFIYTNACGFTLSCNRGTLPVERTSVPTLLPATLPAVGNVTSGEVVTDKCLVAAADLMGAWVNAGSSETDPFQFVDANGQNCESTFADVKPLFIESNIWYSGSMSCVACHGADLTTASAQLDLSNFTGITAGSRRADAESKGTDIFGAGKWDSSLLFEFISTSKADIPGHNNIVSSRLVYAGSPLPVSDATATPSPVVEATVTATP